MADEDDAQARFNFEMNELCKGHHSASVITAAGKVMAIALSTANESETIRKAVKDTAWLLYCDAIMLWKDRQNRESN